MKKIVYLFCFGCFFYACGETSKETSNKEEKTLEKAEITTEETTESKDYPFPIYTSFNEFEPWLNRKSDTTYVVNFWATWCKPCVAELPYFETLTENYKDQKVKVVLVSLDFANQLTKKLIPFVEENKLKSDVVALFDGNYDSWIDKVNKEWDGAIPVTLIYNKDTRKFIGKQFHDFEDLDNSLKEFLGSNS